MQPTDLRPVLVRPLALLLAGGAWSMFLLAGRILATGHLFYAFLAWNLFLAFIPLFLARCLGPLRPGLPALLLLAAWLLFFPNAPYLVTDLLHLRARPGVPQWFDLLLLLSFAMVALFAGFESLRAVHRWIDERFSPRTGWIAAVGFLFLSGYGVYLGRFQRWNSWDLLHHPAALLHDVAGPALDPLAHPRAWAFSLGFGVLLCTLYLVAHPVRPAHRAAPDAGGSR